jgi:hypothetical protein
MENLGLFYDHLVYFMIIWSILRPLEIFQGHLVYFVVNWYIFPHFGILYQGKSGNPASWRYHIFFLFAELRQFLIILF